MKRIIAIPIYVVLIVIALLSTVGIIVDSSTGNAEPMPHCQKVLVSIGSHNYNGTACNVSTNNWIEIPPKGFRWDITFDGGLTNGFSLFAFKFTPGK